MKTFTVADLTLRDLLKVTKYGIKYSAILLFGLGIIYGIISALGYGYEEATKSAFGVEPVNWFWSKIPKSAKFALIIVLALLPLRGFVVALLSEFGKYLIDFGQWLEKTSFKVRFLLAIALTTFFVLIEYAPWLGFAFLIVIGSFGEGYLAVKREKLETMEEDERL